MDWSALASTGIGAVLGAGAMLLSDRVRWGRDGVYRASETRRLVYLEYVGTLNAVSESLRAIALRDHSVAAEVATSARETFREAGAYVVRDKLMITAPEPVASAADQAFYCLRDIRDAVARGTPVESDEYQELFSKYITRSREMRNQMRIDLGADSLSFDWLPW